MARGIIKVWIIVGELTVFATTTKTKQNTKTGNDG